MGREALGTAKAGNVVQPRVEEVGEKDGDWKDLGHWDSVALA